MPSCAGFMLNAMPWSSFVAIGDSFTEGMVDDFGADGRHRGWADRLAGHLASLQPDFQYANLAVRGKVLAEIHAEQVPVAVSLQPQLVSLAGGVNDAMRRTFDVQQSATHLESSVRALRSSGAHVLLFAFGDPSRRSRVFGVMRERLRALNSATRAIARAYDCSLVDFWGAAAFDPDDMWGDDRLHLAPVGHDRAARAALEALGLGPDDWRNPGLWPRPNPVIAGRHHARWAVRHGAPWLARRIRGTSSGSDISPKRPALAPIDPQPLSTLV
jgi:lysophospholipase L1-like esterase